VNGDATSGIFITNKGGKINEKNEAFGLQIVMDFGKP